MTSPTTFTSVALPEIAANDTITKQLLNDKRSFIQENCFDQKPLRLRNTSKTTALQDQLLYSLATRTWRPYDLCFIQKLGNCLVSNTHIKRGALICEYVGYVQIIPKVVEADEEYLILEKDHKGKYWGLFSTRFANESRYIAGIPQCQVERANCVIQRLWYRDSPHAYIFAKKDIEPYEIFYIDYGNEFPTDGFIFQQYANNKVPPKNQQIDDTGLKDKKFLFKETASLVKYEIKGSCEKFHTLDDVIQKDCLDSFRQPNEKPLKMQSEIAATNQTEVRSLEILEKAVIANKLQVPLEVPEEIAAANQLLVLPLPAPGEIVVIDQSQMQLSLQSQKHQRLGWVNEPEISDAANEREAETLETLIGGVIINELLAPSLEICEEMVAANQVQVSPLQAPEEIVGIDQPQMRLSSDTEMQKCFEQGSSSEVCNIFEKQRFDNAEEQKVHSQLIAFQNKLETKFFSARTSQNFAKYIRQQIGQIKKTPSLQSLLIEILNVFKAMCDINTNDVVIQEWVCLLSFLQTNLPLPETYFHHLWFKTQLDRQRVKDQFSNYFYRSSVAKWVASRRK